MAIELAIKISTIYEFDNTIEQSNRTIDTVQIEQKTIQAVLEHNWVVAQKCVLIQFLYIHTCQCIVM